MQKISLPFIRVMGGAILATCLFSACSPKFDWRDYRSPDAPYTALFPGKPSTFSRPIDLNGMKVTMSMTATEIDGTTFAIGSAEVPEASMAPAALAAMKTALLRNINGSIQDEKSAASATATSAGQQRQASLEVAASGTQNGIPVVLNGRFIARDKRIYQIIVLGRAKNTVPETIETFLASVKLN